MICEAVRQKFASSDIGSIAEALTTVTVQIEVLENRQLVGNCATRDDQMVERADPTKERGDVLGLCKVKNITSNPVLQAGVCLQLRLRKQPSNSTANPLFGRSDLPWREQVRKHDQKQWYESRLFDDMES